MPSRFASLQERHEPLFREMVNQLERTAAVENHWLIYSLLGWENLAACVASHYLVSISHVVDRWPYVLVWAVQIAVGLLTIRFISGPPRIEDSPLQPIVRRLATIFVILCCNVAVLNVLAGFPVFTYLPVLATLSSFLFLVLASVISARFVAAALFLFVAGTLMAKYPAYGFLIYGGAWLVVLQTLGILFRWKRRQWLESVKAGLAAGPQYAYRPESELEL